MNTRTLDGYIDDIETTKEPEEAEIALLGSKPISLDAFPHLKGIFRAGVGKDNVPVEEAQRRGVAVGFPSEDTVAIIYDETASFTCAAIFRMAYSNVGTIEPWHKEPRRAMKDKELLVVGTGNIGGRVVSKMGPFMRVSSYDSGRDDPGSLEGLVRRADIVTLHIPYSRENHDFFDRSRLSWMKDGAVLINNSRGALVSEDALFEEVSNGRLRAAFDVYWKEPYEGRLRQFHPERFFMTPHVASTCTAFLEGTVRDLRNFMKKAGP